MLPLLLVPKRVYFRLLDEWILTRETFFLFWLYSSSHISDEDTCMVQHLTLFLFIAATAQMSFSPTIGKSGLKSLRT